MAQTYNNTPTADDSEEPPNHSQQPLVYNLFGWKQSKKAKICMVSMFAVAVGLIFLGMSLTIAGYISAEGNQALKIGGPTVLALGVLTLIGCIVQCCVRTEQYKNTLDDDSEFGSNTNIRTVEQPRVALKPVKSYSSYTSKQRAAPVQAVQPTNKHAPKERGPGAAPMYFTSQSGPIVKTNRDAPSTRYVDTRPQQSVNIQYSQPKEHQVMLNNPNPVITASSTSPLTNTSKPSWGRSASQSGDQPNLKHGDNIKAQHAHPMFNVPKESTLKDTIDNNNDNGIINESFEESPTHKPNIRRETNENRHNKGNYPSRNDGERNRGRELIKEGDKKYREHSRGREGYRSRDRRENDRSYDHDRSRDHSRGRNHARYERDKDYRDHSRGRDGDYSRGRDGDYSRGKDRDYSRGRDRDYSRGRDRDYSRGRDRDYSRGKDKDYSRGYDRDRSRGKYEGSHSRDSSRSRLNRRSFEDFTTMDYVSGMPLDSSLYKRRGDDSSSTLRHNRSEDDVFHRSGHRRSKSSGRYKERNRSRSRDRGQRRAFDDYDINRPHKHDYSSSTDRSRSRPYPIDDVKPYGRRNSNETNITELVPFSPMSASDTGNGTQSNMNVISPAMTININAQAGSAVHLALGANKAALATGENMPRLKIEQLPPSSSGSGEDSRA